MSQDHVAEMTSGARLRCPDCHHNGCEVESGELICNACGRVFPLRNGVPVMYPSSLSDLARSEIDYWDQRSVSEFAGDNPLESWYSRDYFYDDEWGMYGYRKFISALPSTAPTLEVGAGAVARSFFLVKISRVSSHYYHGRFGLAT